MALVSGIQGSLRPSQVITWADEDGVALVLTGATLTGKIQLIKTGVIRAITGLLLLTDAPNGTFTWVYSPEDLATIGLHSVQFTAVFSSGITPSKSFGIEWYVDLSL